MTPTLPENSVAAPPGVEKCHAGMTNPYRPPSHPTGMTESARNYVGLAILMLCALAGVMIFQFRGPLARLAEGKGSPRIIRHSVTVKPARLAVGSLENLAPLATVSVSSAVEDGGRPL
jgi:hypothetical protein